VIFYHWVPSTNAIYQNIQLGRIGVNMFFVLSGFLITQILLDNRKKIEHLSASRGPLLKNFYIRRALRIFPIYYLTIFVLLIFHNHTGTLVKPGFAYYATYTCNFWYFFKGSTDGIISHLWSLSAEEQFYFIWPVIMLFTNKRYLLHVIIIFMLIGIVSSFLLRGFPLSIALPFTCFDAFGLGALLSWQITYGSKSVHRFYKGLSYCAGISLIWLIIYVALSSTYYIPFRTVTSVLGLWLITYIIIYQNNAGSAFKLFWNNRILLFIGKISYGLYIYHFMIGSFNLKIIKRYFHPLLPDFLVRKYWYQLFMAENILLLLIIATLSYVFIEKKFLRMKKYFEYPRNHRPELVTISPASVSTYGINEPGKN
jgi:peptidoglycan/LPS O-acetylase OafA/YrhL